MSTIASLSALLSEHLGTAIDQVKPGSLIQNYLGADSFDTMNLLMEIEEVFDIDLDDSEIHFPTITVRSLADLIDAKLRALGRELETDPVAPQEPVSSIPGKYNTIDPRTKLKPGEPWFFLRAQDVHAPATVRSYASVLSSSGDAKGSREVYALADAMAAWQTANPDHVKRPD